MGPKFVPTVPYIASLACLIYIFWPTATKQLRTKERTHERARLESEERGLWQLLQSSLRILPTVTTRIDMLPLEKTKLITSDDGLHTICLVKAIQALKHKDETESVGVFEGTYDGREVIVKVFLLLGGREHSVRAANEAWALKMVTDADCQHAPRLMATFDRTLNGALCSVEKFVVMSKLPGVLISETMLTDQQTRWQIRGAFRTAIAAVHDAGVDNHSPHNGNVLWDAVGDRCYIIDFERAQLVSDLTGEELQERKAFETWFDNGTFFQPPSMMRAE